MTAGAEIQGGDDKASPRGDQVLPPRFLDWFTSRKWLVRDHQAQIFARAEAGETTLLIAPTGGGKTLAGFLPGLVDLDRLRQTQKSTSQTKQITKGVHTLYISPLKALAVDIARNLTAPVSEMGLDIKIETRTGDTPAGRRQRQRISPPDILLTTPEQIALLIADPHAARYFERLTYIVLDELHALAGSKRGDLLSLGLARLQRLAPQSRRIGLSATVADPQHLARFLASGMAQTQAGIIETKGAAAPEMKILTSSTRVPWAGHLARHAVVDIYEALKVNNLSLIFVNTRAQAELLFQELWDINDDNLAIALHHGSLAVERRRKVEAAMAAGTLRAVVSTSTLDMGIDWGDVDLVINVGAPKGSSRLMQRIGRANHRLDTPSRALLVPANRFEVLECRAALDAVREAHQDAHIERRGGLDVLAQHVLGMAVAGPISIDEVAEEVTSAAPYAHLGREDVAKVVEFVSTGGYALSAYERYARLRPTDDGRLAVAHHKVTQRYRMNVGTIVEEPLLKVRLASGKNRRRGPLRGGFVLGEIEEYFIDQLVPGDTFLFAGQVLRFEGMSETDALASRTTADAPKIPSYFGGKFPLSTYLAERVRKLLATPETWDELPAQVREWLQAQRWASVLPEPDGLLIETFPRADKHYMVCYPFDGRLAHQTLGMLLTRRLERLGARPLGFVASEYALAIWSLRDLGLMASQGSLDWQLLFSEDMLGDDLEAWIFESSLMKRTFRNCAIISGLVEKRFPGREKSGRQMTVSTDLIYDVLRAHEPDHVLMRAAWEDASSGLLDVKRLGKLLTRIRGRITHKPLTRVSPLAVPVMLEIGREAVQGSAQDELMAEAADEMAEEAMRLV